MTLQLQNNSWLTACPWAEYHSRAGGVADANLSYEGGQQATKTILIYFDDLNLACQAILGVNQFLPFFPSGPVLSRMLPLRHPEMPWLYASRIASIRPRQPIAKYQTTRGASTRYVYYMLTIMFEAPKWSMISDVDLDFQFGTNPRAEWMRFTTVRPVSNSEVISRNGTFFWQSEGSVIGPVNQASVPGNIGQRLRKTTYEVVWHRVPRLGLMAQQGAGDPVNMFLVVDSVNANLGVTPPGFLGKTPGTLLMGHPAFEELSEPYDINTIGTGLTGLSSTAPVEYNVRIPFIEFDPDTDPRRIAGGTRGHNLMPYQGPGTGNGLWYLANTQPNGTGMPLYGALDLRTAFLLQR